MSIASEISRLQGAKASAKAAIESKGVTVPSSALVDSYYSYISAIPNASEVINVTITVPDVGTVTAYDNETGTVIATQNFSSATTLNFSISGGINYTISISGNKVYVPSSYTNIAHSGNVRNISFAGLNTGVFIYYTDGTMSAYNSLVSGKTVVGVALITSNCSFVIYKYQYSGYQWGKNDQLIAGCNSFVDWNKDGANSDYNGKSNTDAIIEESGTEQSAAKIARNNPVYTNGAIGYLPAGGEMLSIRLNKDNINTALSLIGGDTINTSAHWTSTQVDAYFAWSCESTSCTNVRKGNTYYKFRSIASL